MSWKPLISSPRDHFVTYNLPLLNHPLPSSPSQQPHHQSPSLIASPSPKSHQQRRTSAAWVRMCVCFVYRLWDEVAGSAVYESRTALPDPRQSSMIGGENQIRYEQKKVSKRSNQSDSKLSLKEAENIENSSPKDTSDGTVEAETIEQDSGVDVGTLSEKVSIKAVPKKLKDLLDTGDAVLAVVAMVVVIDLTLHYRSVSNEAKDLLRKMLCKNVSRRLSAEQVL
ncbi:hypothetical protein Droror1_Dr00021609, partial [Drosera rotundifolia]